MKMKIENGEVHRTLERVLFTCAFERIKTSLVENYLSYCQRLSKDL